MSPLEKRIFTLPQETENKIKQLLKDRGLSFADSKRIAECVLLSSNYYLENPDAQTPWENPWAQIAQIAYYLPLNSLRSQAVYQEALNVGFPMGKRLLDYGSGLGAGSLPWLNRKWDQVTFMEQSGKAKELHKSFQTSGKWISEKEISLYREREDDPLKQATALFSYSLTELKQLPNWAMAAENLVLIEPATKDDGRKLLEIRKQLISKGYSVWAPCTHQGDCPLLEKSKGDWCHDRIHVEMPKWFLEIEKNLPIKNQTLTMSYLLASRSVAPKTDKWRLTGDSLEEKGKTRQLVCRSPEREYLAWMHRHGIPAEWHRGHLIDPIQVEVKSNELRIKTSDSK